MRINIEDIFKMQEQRAKWNHPLLDTLEFYEGGKKIDIDAQVIDRFMKTGLNNIDFITSGYYLRRNAT